jgi:2-oxoisovalerate dehydrogenase E2 component (dihydrolipoyl transacylase)
MNKEFRLPDVGEGLTEADIVSWHVKPGDTVEINQIIVEIETAKAVVELPSPWAGRVTALLTAEGETVDVGTPIITVEVTGTDVPSTGAEPIAAQTPAAEAAPAEQEPPARQAVLVGYGVKPGATTRRPRKAPSTRPASYPATPSPLPARGPVPSQPSPSPAGARALAKPPVRKLAKDLGVDLGALAGSGPEGSVTREDVQRAAGGATVRSGYEKGVTGAGPAVVAAPSPIGTEERIPVRGVRKHTAAAMVASAFSAPHVTEFLQVDVTETMAAVRRARELPEFARVKVSPLLFVAKALLVAVARNPMINSSWDEAAQEIVVKHYVNLGIAVAAERGLLVPSVKGAHALPLAELARALDELAATAREGKATPADLSGGTITITNVGVFGIDAGTPILSPGEAAILAFGQVRDTPWVHQGELAVRKVTTLSLSFDHRIVDGALGSAVLRDVGSMLEDPVRMLAWS